ncbi:MAG TPA: cytochrome c [Blastocatellia bacterium]|nr:cytochrome c [Blastocatellia bacterium]
MAAAILILISYLKRGQPQPGTVLDEALQVKRDPASFRSADEDYFHDMDGAIALTPEEVKGRNTWIVWTGGNDRFWDEISGRSAGSLDFLKTLSSYDPERDPGATPEEKMRLKGLYKSTRDNRWRYLGLVNEPCFEKATGPDASRFGLWLDRRRSDCPPDPFADEAKYPGVVIGARGRNLPAGSFYGAPTGIVGLRLFPNPDFDEAAAKKWDPVRYYTDPTYYDSKDLIKPYRVGMSCAFCHVGPNPLKPPADPENPRWENLSSNVGAQYFWIDRIFSWQAEPSNFVFQLFHTSRPGALDTSLVSTDNINNPRTMNAVYNLGPRLEFAKRWGKETLAGGGLDNKQLNDYVAGGPLTEFFQPPATVLTPRVLKDGSDSVGALGALNRVYLNIGLFSEEWLLHFNPLVGGKRITPIEIKVARKNSAYWQATESQTPNMALFFLKSATPHHLKDAPGGAAYLTEDRATVARGKVVFAEYCARCHSSKAPAPPSGADPGGCAGPGYLDCWKAYWNWTKTDEFKTKMRQIVLADDFLENNFLSTDLRVPVTLLQTNACSPLATNALADNIWDNFSSQSYKDLPSVGTITVHHPVTGERREYRMPAGGRGYTRPASLISLWSTAPFLLNNALGKFDPEPSVEARMRSFQNSIEQLLWPERREKDVALGDRVPGVIDRTTATSFLRVPAGYLPDALQSLLDPAARFFPWLFTSAGVEIGPIPAGTPVNLLANLELISESRDPAARLEHGRKVLEVLLKAKRDLKALPQDAGDEEARRVFANLVEPLLELNKCPDFVVNRGHYFGTSYLPEEPALSDADKRALIAFLKTF